MARVNLARRQAAHIVRPANVQHLTAGGATPEHGVRRNGPKAGRNPADVSVAQHLVRVLGNFLPVEAHVRDLFARDHLGRQLVTLVVAAAHVDRRAVGIVAGQDGARRQGSTGRAV